MSFIESPIFPTNISYGSAGGPSYSTTIAVGKSGYESRNSNWSYPLHKYDVAKGVQTLADLEELINFFHIAKGRANGFRYHDPMDYKSCARSATVSATDQYIGTGDGTTTAFQLKKTYTQRGYSQERKITKPVSGTVRISINNVEQTTGWSVNTTTGIITFSTAPASGAIIKAGFEFDTPVRFDTDELSIQITDYELGSVQAPLVEIKL